jgi:hypothetical protein
MPREIQWLATSIFPFRPLAGRVAEHYFDAIWPIGIHEVLPMANGARHAVEVQILLSQYWFFSP